MSTIPFVTVVSYMSIRVESWDLLSWAFCSNSNHRFVFILKRLLRTWKFSALKSIPTSKRFHLFNNDGTGKCMWLLVLQRYKSLIRHTNPNHLLPIGMVHMCIQHLLSMHQRHTTNAPGDVVQWCPQCLNYLSIHLPCTTDVAWWISGKAWVLVAMNVKQPNSCSKLQRARQRQLWTSFHPLHQVNPILAHDIIHHQSHRQVFHIIWQCFAKAIVHVELPGIGRRLFPTLYHAMECTYFSPFWKSTTVAGMKNPWQQAVAPMPVTSRCGLLEFACSMALYVLHVLGYETVNLSDMIGIHCVPDWFLGHCGDGLYMAQG